MTDNHIARRLEVKVVPCAQCGGKGTVPADDLNLDNDIEKDCLMCGGEGQLEMDK